MLGLECFFALHSEEHCERAGVPPTRPAKMAEWRARLARARRRYATAASEFAAALHYHEVGRVEK
jgi:hypothetical protein